MNVIDKKLWGAIQKKASCCACGKNNKQQKLSEYLEKEYRYTYNFEREMFCVDKCGNSLKINLMDLKKILEKVGK